MKIPQKAKNLMTQLDYENPRVKEMTDSGEMDDFFQEITNQIEELHLRGPRSMTDVFNQLKVIFPEHDYFKVEFADKSIYNNEVNEKIFSLVLKYGTTAEFNTKDDRFDLISEYFYTAALLKAGFLTKGYDFSLNIQRQAFYAMKNLLMKIRLNPSLAKSALFNHFLSTGEVVKFDT